MSNFMKNSKELNLDSHPPNKFCDSFSKMMKNAFISSLKHFSFSRYLHICLDFCSCTKKVC